MPSRRDYEKIAQVLRETKADPMLKEVIANVLQQSFSNFNRDKFLGDSRRADNQVSQSIVSEPVLQVKGGVLPIENYGQIPAETSANETDVGGQRI